MMTTPLSRLALSLILTLFTPLFANATTVQFQTVLGDFEVNLYDESTPETVANFLAYVNAQAYNDNVIHRSVNGFIVQGGGYSFSAPSSLNAIAQNSAVINEPKFSNVRGTIAMAKLGSDANSATNQWFINLSDNSGGSSKLDVQNGGFTVFGEVVRNGMAVVDAIAALPKFNLGGAFNTIPLRDYTSENATDGVTPNGDNYVTITAIVVLDAATDTAADLQPTPNTLLGQSSDDSGGGSTSMLFLISLGLLALVKKSLTRR